MLYNFLKQKNCSHGLFFSLFVLFLSKYNFFSDQLMYSGNVAVVIINYMYVTNYEEKK